MHWTPDAITTVIDHFTVLVGAIGAVIGAIKTMSKLFSHNKELTDRLSDSTPPAVVEAITKNLTTATPQAAGNTTVNVNEPGVDKT